MNQQILSPERLRVARADFVGAKLILFLGDALAVLRRDDLPSLPYANCLDLPGGLREPGETPEACVLRELQEELGLSLLSSALKDPWFYAAPARSWFFVAHLPAQRANDIVFGNEGQGWSLMNPWDYVTSEEAVPHFRARVRARLTARPGPSVA